MGAGWKVNRSASHQMALRMEVKRSAAIQHSRFRSSSQQNRGKGFMSAARVGRHCASVLKHQEVRLLLSRPTTDVCRGIAVRCRLHVGHCIILSIITSSFKAAWWPTVYVSCRRYGKLESGELRGATDVILAGTIDVWSSSAH